MPSTDTDTYDKFEGPYGKQRRLEQKADRERAQAAIDKQAEWAAEQAKRQAATDAEETARRQLEDRRNRAATDATQPVLLDATFAALEATSKCQAAWDKAAQDPSAGRDVMGPLYDARYEAQHNAAVVSEFGNPEATRARLDGPAPQSFDDAYQSVLASRAEAKAAALYAQLVADVNKAATKASAAVK